MSTVFRVLVKPNAKSTRLIAKDVAASPVTLEVAVGAAPVDGAANTELIKFLSKSLGVPKTSLSVVRGTSGREKFLACTQQVDFSRLPVSD
jgi:uncharacterized protein YggU (UPF0235/DUF167 family)